LKVDERRRVVSEGGRSKKEWKQRVGGEEEESEDEQRRQHLVDFLFFLFAACTLADSVTIALDSSTTYRSLSLNFSPLAFALRAATRVASLFLLPPLSLLSRAFKFT
jgi:hypothetical protein